MRIGIVGAGIAGLAAGAFLSKAGHEVELFDSQRVLSPAGGGLLLQPAGLIALDALGVLERARLRGSRIEQLVRQHRSGRVTARLHYAGHRAGVHGLGITRPALVGLLRSAAIAAGCALRLDTEIDDIRSSDRDVTLLGPTRERLGTCALVVVADGMRSRLRRRLGLVVDERPCAWGTLSMVAARRADFPGDRLLQRFSRGSDVIGLLPSGRDEQRNEWLTWFQNMRVDEYDSPDRMPFELWKSRAAEVSPESGTLLADAAGFDALHFARYSLVHMPRWHLGRCVVIGDAAHALDPLLGMGASMALLDAEALAACLRPAHAESLADALDRFQQIRMPSIAACRRAGLVMESLLRTDGPIGSRVPDVALRALMAFPAVSRKALALMFGDSPERGSDGRLDSGRAGLRPR